MDLNFCNFKKCITGDSNVQPGIKPTELEQESEGKVQEEFKTKWHFLMSGNRLQRALGQTGGGRATGQGVWQ